MKEKPLIVACSFLWAGCIDKLMEIEECVQRIEIKEPKQSQRSLFSFLNIFSKKKVAPKVYFMDTSENELFHMDFKQTFADSYDLFGLFFKDLRYLKRLKKGNKAQKGML